MMDEDQTIRLEALRVAVALTGALYPQAEEDDPDKVRDPARDAIRVADAFVKYIQNNDPHPIL